jgi:two-component system, NarL family, nitrate/nitrite response regulator NarL
MRERIRVLIVEDHQVLAEGLEFALGRQPDLEVVGVVGSVAEAAPRAIEERPHVVLMDFHLPDGNGAQASTAIRRQLPDVAVVILTADTAESSMLAAVQAGARGWLVKTATAAQVVDAVRRAAAGEMLIPSATLARMIELQQEESDRQRVRDSVTPRELQVLQLMAEGLDSRAIAENLVLSLPTVRGYVQTVIEKLGTHSRLEAVARARALGLLDP